MENCLLPTENLLHAAGFKFYYDVLGVFKPSLQIPTTNVSASLRFQFIDDNIGGGVMIILYTGYSYLPINLIYN